MPKAAVTNPLLHTVFIAILAAFIYSNTFDVPFLFDDDPNIVANPAVKSLDYFRSSTLPADAGTANITSTFRTRYIAYLTFALNYKFGGLDVTGYHAVNLTIHIVNGLLVYSLFALLVTALYPEAAGRGHPAAFFASILFISHPVHTQAVTYIVQRMTSLLTLFFLLSIVMYMLARLSPHRGRRALYYTFAFCSAILAMKTKENSFTLPFMILLCETMFFKEKPKKRLSYLIPFFLALLVIPLSMIEADGLRDVVGALRRHIASISSGEAVGISHRDYILTEPRVIVTYIRLLLLPMNQNFDYNYPVYSSVFSASVLLSTIFLLLLLGLGIYLLWRSTAGGAWLRLPAFGIFWFFITISVESGMVAIADVIFEHRLYLPSVGFFTALPALTIPSADRSRPNRKRYSALLFLTATAILFSLAAYERNKLWRDPVVFSEDIIRKSQGKARPHVFLGNAYHSKGLNDLAAAQYRIATAIDPQNLDAHIGLCALYINEGLLDKAVERCHAALKLSPGNPKVHNNLGIAYVYQGAAGRAIEHYLASLSVSPGSAGVHFNLGLAYEKLGRFREAAVEYETASRLDPSHVKAHNNLGVIYDRLGMYEEARAKFEKALRLQPNYTNALDNLRSIDEKLGHSRRSP